ncbi:uncharacterized protein LOC120140988 [Hibiscus syriacus]|uniref:uncharacterized protein LOC120140988 n=1 Tax=Hibiscus syriacus TaxID=106335 RepID=UPI001921E531|nr:uncharacterized protein LOC120140988 [Hibiscus syriacus]
MACNNMKPKSQKYLVRNKLAAKPATYSTTVSADIPLYETPQDGPRAFVATFPGNHGIQQHTQNIWPMIDFRLGCKSKGRDYPPQVPQDVTKVLEFHTTRWQLQGLDNFIDPSYFKLAVNGRLYPDRRGNKSQIRGDSELNISIMYPPAFTLIPDGIRDSLVKGVMEEIAKRMTQNVDDRRLADYRKFKNERSDKRRNLTKL